MSTKISVIQPNNKFSFVDIRELWTYRELLMAFVTRDITAKYRQTIVGGGWAIIQPLLTMIVFSFFFGKLAKMPSDGVPYPVFSYSGLLLWTYFSNALSGASNSMVSASSLITKVYFPRILIPLATTLQFLIDYAFAGIVLLLLLWYYQIPITIKLLAVPIIALITCLLASGMGFFLAAVNVKFRDVRFVLPFFIQLMLYITPVIYPSSVAERFRLILALNPMTGLIEAHRAIILSKPIPWESFGISILLTFLLLFLGIIYFKRVEKSFADVI
jgi:lipopolysaccharide transport system permease protein